MSWPLSQDYNEAIQDPPSAFKDPELRGGELRLNALGLPLPRSGNFADVYEVNCPASQSKWAVKCFTREVHGLQQRYSAISRHLKDANLPFTVDFQFLDQGIRIGAQWYPVLKMRWVEGLLLNEFVRDALDKPALLQALQQIWGRLAKRLREADIAHADLQHGNVLLVPGSKAAALAVKLIDYDGMWVPALAQTKSGEVGHPNYQHPQRLREGTYNREVDRFPFLVTATALRALAIGGRSLWERYDNGDNLLFKETDLRAPQESALFQELSGFSDSVVKKLVGRLRQACLARLEETPLLEEAMPEEKATLQTAPPPLPVAAAPVAAAWDFQTGAAPADGDRRKSGTKKASRKPAASGVPVWVWAAGGGGGVAAVVALIVAVVLLSSDGDTPSSNQVALNNPSATSKVSGPIPSPPAPPTSAPGFDTRPKPPDTGKPKPPPLGPIAPRPLFRMLGNSNDLVARADDPTAVWELYSSLQQRVVQRFVVPKPTPVLAFDATPDGAFVITTCADKHAYIWDTKTGEAILTEPTGQRLAVVAALAPDGKTAYLSSGGRTYGVWDVQQKRNRVGITVKGNIAAFAVSPDGKWIAYGLGEDGAMQQRIAVRKVRGGDDRELGSHPGRITCLAFSSDGMLLASGGTDNEVRLWDVENGGERGRFAGLHAPASVIRFSSNSGIVIAEDGFGTVVWNTKTRNTVSGVRKGPEDRVTCNFDFGGRQLAYFTEEKGQRGVRWGASLPADDAAGPPPVVAGGKGPFQMLSGWPDSVAMTEGDGSVWRLQNVQQQDKVTRFVGHKGPIKCLRATATGQFAITGGDDGTARVWEVESGKQISELKGHDRAVIAVAMTASASKALTADGLEVILWDVPGAVVLHRFKMPGPVSAMAFSGDDKYIAFCYSFGGDADGRVQVRALQGKQPVKEVREQLNPISCVAFSLSSKIVVAACGQGKVLKFNHEALQSESFATLSTEQPVHTITFAADGDHLLLSAGRSYSLCSFAARKEIANQVAPDGQMAAVLTDDGRKVVQVSRRPDGTLARFSMAVPEAAVVASPPKPNRPQGPRFKVPPPGQYAFVEKLLHEHFNELYTKKSPDLEKTLSDLADHPIAGMVGAPDGRYVALIEARDFAIKRGDPISTVSYSKRIAAKYEVSLLDAVAEGLEKLLPFAKDPPTHKTAAEQALELFEQAPEEERTAAAFRLLDVAKDAAAKANDAPLRERVDRVIRALRGAQETSKELTKALAKLEKDPDDQDANQVVGRVRCLENRWEEGLRHLAKGNDLELRQVAAKDLAGAADGPGCRMLGDAWYDQANKQTQKLRLMCLRRAHDWYTKALPGLTGDDAKKVNTKLTALEKKVPKLADKAGGPLEKTP